MFREYFAGWPFPRDTHENLQAGMTLHLPIICSTRGSFAGKLLTGKLLARHSRNPLVHPLNLSLHTL